MNDSNWDSAPEGATEIAVYIDGDLRWATPSHTWSFNMHGWKYRPSEWQTIATRPQPEQPRKTEGASAWTHEINGLHCKVLTDKKDCLGNIVVELHGSGYATPKAHTVKPIRPAITKAEAWDMLTKLNGKYQNMDVMTAIMTLCDEHEVVE